MLPAENTSFFPVGFGKTQQSSETKQNKTKQNKEKQCKTKEYKTLRTSDKGKN